MPFPDLSLIKTTFGGGELAPSLYSRIDLQLYLKGCKTLRNCIVLPHGGITRRPGLRKIAAAKSDGEKIRLIPFEFSRTQNYMIEFGDYYARFFYQKQPITTSQYTSDSYTKLLLHFESSPFIDSSDNVHTLINSGVLLDDFIEG